MTESFNAPPFVRGCASGSTRSFRRQAWVGLTQRIIGVESTNSTNGIIRIAGIRPDVVQQALAALLNRYPVLNSRLEDRDGDPWIIPLQSSEPLIQWLRIGTGPEAQAEWQQTVGPVVWSEMDFVEGPLYRAYAIQSGSLEGYIGLVAHHFVADAFSIQILMSELKQLYDGYASAQKNLLSDPGLSYPDYLHTMSRWIETSDGLNIRTSNIERLQYMRAINFRPYQDSGNPTSQSFRFSSELSAHIRNSARVHKVTPFTFMLAVQNILLFPLANTSIVPLKIISSGRNLAPLVRTVGNLADPIYVLTDLSGNPDVGEVVARTQRALEASLKYGSIPNDFVHPDLISRGISPDIPVFNWLVGTSFEGASSQKFSVPPPPGIAVRPTSNPYYLKIFDDGGELSGQIQYGAGEIGGFMPELEAIISKCCGDPSAKLSTLASELWCDKLML